MRNSYSVIPKKTSSTFSLKRFAVCTSIMATCAFSSMSVQAAEPVAKAVTQTAPEVSALELAYKKEFTFLKAQKNDLQKRLTSLLQDTNKQFDTEKSRLIELEKNVLGSNGRVEINKSLLLDTQRLIEANEDIQQVFEATFLQADVALEKYQGSLENDKTFQSLNDGQKVSELFKRSQKLLKKLSSVTIKNGDFHLLDGSKVGGDIIHFGNVARFGISMSPSNEVQGGMLAPAGEGLFKLWEQDNAPLGLETAKALHQGEIPATLEMFLIENPQAAVQAQKEKTVMDILKSGGIIGMIIVAFGIAALLMVLARALFLRRASHASSGVLAAVRPAIEEGDINKAMDISRQFDGATSRVVRATVRNLDRDREHLEDIVSESILHESEHLDRFGTTILVLASVSPLMGLLGTVTGMITTFDVITEFGTGDPKMLSGGISEALVTTELGLIVAIPAVLLGNLLSGWAIRIKNDMELGALHLINVFKQKQDQVPDKEAA